MWFAIGGRGRLGLSLPHWGCSHTVCFFLHGGGSVCASLIGGGSVRAPLIGEGIVCAHLIGGRVVCVHLIGGRILYVFLIGFVSVILDVYNQIKLTQWE